MTGVQTCALPISNGTPSGTLKELFETTGSMWVSPVLAVATFAGLALWHPLALGDASSVLVLWFLSPVLVWWLDRPLLRRRALISAKQIVFLRRMARRTWAFFETYVTAEDNHLPPDNMQESPVARVAHRTSPTNMGFALMANMTARDLDRKSTRLNSSHYALSRMPSSA